MAQKDRRYEINMEFTGHASGKKRAVMRFLGNWVQDFATRQEAERELSRRKKEGDHPPFVRHSEAIA